MKKEFKLASKEFWRLFGIFFALVFVLLGINIGFMKLGEKKWRNSLSKSVQTVLDEKFPGYWTVKDFRTIENPFSTSAALFEIRANKSGEKSNAIIIRTQTLYGPYPSVFIFDGKDEPEFVGYSLVHGRIRALMEERPSDIFISYWARRIPCIVKNCVEKERT